MMTLDQKISKAVFEHAGRNFVFKYLTRFGASYLVWFMLGFASANLFFKF